MYSSFTSTCIEGIPFIIRFKTLQIRLPIKLSQKRIEGIPFIIRFKTIEAENENEGKEGIEGIPFIIRFKTSTSFQIYVHHKTLY